MTHYGLSSLSRKPIPIPVVSVNEYLRLSFWSTPRRPCQYAIWRMRTN